MKNKVHEIIRICNNWNLIETSFSNILIKKNKKMDFENKDRLILLLKYKKKERSQQSIVSMIL